MGTTLETDDMQGILVSSYSRLTCAAYLLYRIVDGPTAAAWLDTLRGRITTAAGADNVRSANLAFTQSGLSRLGLPPSALATFPNAFQDGMASARRSRVLGDSGPNAPTQWRWGGEKSQVDILVMLYAVDEAEIARELAQWRPGRGVEEVAFLQAGRQKDAREHFGFLDGVGQPVIEGSGASARQEERTGHATDVKAGEFVLGYDNVYNAQPPMPSVEAADDTAGRLPRISDPSGPHALGRNGSYLVFRQMSQDVPAFWQQMRKVGGRVWPDDPEGAVRAAAKTVGRWPSGEPLVRSPHADPFDGVPQDHPDNTFAYDAEDPHGDACPLGAHIRRANPRDALGPDPTTARDAVNRHRLLRRGRSYGERLPDDRLTEDDGKERGLHFICLNADLERQFEFVQQTWVNNPVFAGLLGETDPIVGDQSACVGKFTIQATPLRRTVSDLCGFVTVRGGGYFFLPGIKAIEYLTSDKR